MTMTNASQSCSTGDALLPGNKTRRHGRVSNEGQAYFLTTATMYHRPVFLDTTASRSACRAIHQAWLWRDSTLLAWVLMPDHWQGLVRLGGQDDLSTLVGRFKAVTARAVPERSRVNGWLWSRGFQDRALGSDESLREAARFLVGNPLRAGLAEDIGGYPYWNAAWVGSSSDTGIPI